MRSSNQKTITAYNSSAEEYITHTPNTRNVDILNWIARSVQSFHPTAKILEIGSATGVDAAILENMGFDVEKTDAAESFVSILQKKDPSARLFNILTDPIQGNYDLVFANAVFLHFTQEEMELSISKVYSSLNNEGVLAFTLKEGDGELWQENKNMPPRFFRYWRKDPIVQLLQFTGFADIDAQVVSSGEHSSTWIMIIAKKF